MKVLLITSEITFVPRNYQMLTLGLSDIPEVCGLMVVRNRSWPILKQGLFGIVSQAAPALGWQIVKNFFSPTNFIRRQVYESNNKKFWLVDDLNAPSTLSIIKNEGVDLIVNARTRTMFKRPLLETPRLGCLNIHHGLLPEQKGLMCDFWAHVEESRCGFTLHQMSMDMDDGPILRRVEVPRSASSYFEYLERSTLLELAMLRNYLREIRDWKSVKGAENFLSVPFRYRKNPNLEDFLKLKKLGIKI